MQMASVALAGGYDHVFVSPHHDDLALSGGGIVLAANARGERVLAVAVFVGRPPSSAPMTEFAAFQHRQWGSPDDPWEARRAEERTVMASLDVDYLWLDFLDAIYRGDQYLSDQDLFGPIKPGDMPVQRALAADLLELARHSPTATIYLPLGVGQHVDHQLCFLALDQLLAEGRTVALYEDVPYALSSGTAEARVRSLARDIRPRVVEIGALIEPKVRLVDAYRSQTDWIFRHYGPADEALRRHAAELSREPGGYAERLWVPAQSVADPCTGG